MIKKIIRVAFSLVGMTLGLALYFFLMEKLEANQFVISTEVKWFSLAISVVSFGALFEVLTPFLTKSGQEVISMIERETSKIGVLDLLTSLMGVLIGLIIAYFIGGLTAKVPFVGTALTIIVYMFFVFLGYALTTKRKDEISFLIQSYRISPQRERAGKRMIKGSPKVLDTSVIIDGRILDIAATGFVEGKLIVPNFVLEELRHIADSSDDLKRIKGRRGLDILNTMQEKLKMEMEISDADFSEIAEVDMKLLKLAQTLDGQVLTNDYNLNKVAQFQGVMVLNINELANAVKTVVIPGEEMVVTIIKEGKEYNQGVAYLDDGTMIVVENAKKLIGETVTVVVTTVLQTAAGRMIFARQK